MLRRVATLVSRCKLVHCAGPTAGVPWGEGKKDEEEELTINCTCTDDLRARSDKRGRGQEQEFCFGREGADVEAKGARRPTRQAVVMRHERGWGVKGAQPEHRVQDRGEAPERDQPRSVERGCGVQRECRGGIVLRQQPQRL